MDTVTLRYCFGLFGTLGLYAKPFVDGLSSYINI